MLGYIFNIFMPIRSFRRMIPMIGVLVMIALGVGVFLMVQAIMGNYLDSLVQMATASKEEIAIVKNPDRKFMTQDELDEEFFTGKKKDVKERTQISPALCVELTEKIHKVDENLKVQGIVKIPEADFVYTQDGRELHCKPVLIATDISDKNRILPVLDSITVSEIEAFNATDDATIPILTSPNLFPGLKVGECIELVYQQKTQNYKLVGEIQQPDLFKIPTLFLSVASYGKMVENVSFNIVAIRTNMNDSLPLVEQLENQVGEQFIFSHWSEIMKILSGVFNAINMIVSSIIFSLFIIAFIFSTVAFDVIIRKRRKHFALFLALGTSPAKIRRGIYCVSGVIGFSGLVIGILLAKLFLVLAPHTSLKTLFDVMYVHDFSFRCEMGTFVLTLAMVFVASTFSGWLAARRIFKIDPLEDLKK